MTHEPLPLIVLNVTDLNVNYTDHMIRDTLLNGISDFDIRREILGTTDIPATVVNDVIVLVESKEMAQNAILTPDVSVASAFKHQKAIIISKNCRSFSRNSSPYPICKKRFHLYKEGPSEWNTKPYTVCIDCFRTRRRTKHSNFPSPTSTAITDSSGLLESTGHLGAVTKIAPPPLEEQAKISLLESGTFENADHVFQNGQWIKADMCDHLLSKCVFLSIIHGAAPGMPPSWPETCLPLQTPVLKLMCSHCASSYQLALTAGYLFLHQTLSLQTIQASKLMELFSPL